METYGEGARGAAAAIQAAWRGHRYELVAERWRAIVAELREAEAEAEAEDVVAELPGDDDLQAHAPAASPSALLRALSTLTSSKLSSSTKIPQTRVSFALAESERSLTPAAAPQPQPQRRRRTRAQNFAPDREGEYISINNETKAVSGVLAVVLKLAWRTHSQSSGGALA